MTITPKPEHYREAARIVRAGWTADSYAEVESGCSASIAEGRRFCANGALAKAANARLICDGTMPHGDDAHALAAPLVASLRKAGIKLAYDDGMGADDDINEWNNEAESAEHVAAALERCAGELERGELSP